MEEPCHRRNPVTGGVLSPYPLPHSRPFGCYVKAKLPGHTHTDRAGIAKPPGQSQACRLAERQEGQAGSSHN